jgi:hypothetical protein
MHIMTKKSERLWKEAVTEARRKIYEVEKEEERKERHRRLMESLLIPEDF